MPHCERCQDQLLDLVYGLLDTQEQEELHSHLAQCSPCQQALGEAQAQQRLLARAARPMVDVPVFAMPGVEVAATAPATLPLAAAPAKAPRRRFGPLLALTAAAAAVLVAVGTWSLHQQGRNDYVVAFASRQTDVERIEAELAALAPGVQASEESALKQQAGAGLQLQVLGPEQLHPSAASVAQVITRKVEGHGSAPANSEVRVRLEASAGGEVLYDKVVHSDGDARVKLPALGRNADRARLVVTARAGAAQAEVEQPLRIAAPALATHLVASKTQYMPGEALQFRALALDRYALTPPAAAVLLRTELVDASGKAVAHQDGATDAAGVFAGQLPITDALADGGYTLRVRGAGGAVQVAGHEVPVELARGDGPEFQLDKDQYRPGEEVNLYYANRRGLGQNAKPQVIVDNQNVPAQNVPAQMAQTPQAQGGAGGMAQQRFSVANAQNNLQALQLQFSLPKKLSNTAGYADARILLDDGKRKEMLHQSIPVAPSQVSVEFFPEGGDLVNGLSSRVYYRVNAPQGEGSLDGRLTLIGRKERVASSYREGLGILEFTPDAQEEYRVQVTTPAGIATVTQPFQAIGIRPDGLTLRIKDSVGSEGEPIAATLRRRSDAAASRQVMLLVECRGQLVDERLVEVAGDTTVELKPADGARGVLRVTAYAAEPAGWRPLAERLVYRAPAGQLQLRVDRGAQARVQPGQTLNWNITARDEKDAPTSAWALAAVVDEKYRPRETTLASRFLLLGDLRAPLEDVPLLASSTPESPEQMDLFLGTYGWRRFEPTGRLELARREADALDQLAAAPALFSRENASVAELQQQAQARLDTEVQHLRSAAADRQRELSAQKQAAVALLAQARSALEDYDQRPREYLQLGLGVAVCVLVAASVLLLLAGLVNVLRRAPGTSALAGAFACLLVCAGLSAVVLTMKPVQRTADRDVLARAAGLRDVQSPSAPQEARSGPPAAARPLPSPLAAEPQSSGAPAPAQTRPAPKAVPADMARLTEAPPASVPGGVGGQSARAPGGFERPAGHGPAAMRAIAARGMQAPAASGPLARIDAEVKEKVRDEKAADPKQEALVMRRRLASLSFDTVLWRPALWLDKGAGDVTFTAPPAAGEYRVLLFGHTATGRLGFLQERLSVPARQP